MDTLMDRWMDGNAVLLHRVVCGEKEVQSLAAAHCLLEPGLTYDVVGVFSHFWPPSVKI